MAYLPINHHGLIGDLHTAALVGPNGRVVWLPWPRFDSPSLFAAILDDQRGGEWELAPEGVKGSRQLYDGETAILRTEFEVSTGRAEMRDWMTPWDGDAPGHDLCRMLRCTEGVVEIVGRFRPQPDYARARAELRETEDGLSFEAHGLEIRLASTHRWGVEEDAATLRVTLNAGEEIRCVLSSGIEVPLERIDDKLTRTRKFWDQWIGRCQYNGLWAEAVRRSAITLKLCIYAPTGAIVAAPTTSLPEWIGGVRNWDYRFTWLRDASLTLTALYVLGFREEACGFFAWMSDRAAEHETPLQIMFGIGGEADLEESELEHLEGYRGSRPVRIGNGAYDQSQLDVYGGVLDAAYVHEKAGDLLSIEQWDILRREIDYVCVHWNEPDHGIWEIRGPVQHHTFSKLMCWVALDRGIKVAEMESWEYDRERWHKARDEIRESILEHSWDDEVGAFTMTYETKDLDASVLIMPMVGFLPATDPRMLSTIERIDRDLGEGALIYRYHADDGLPGEEGAFLLCSYWMIEALTLAGRLEEAVERFEALLAYLGPQGLLSEEVDPATGTAVGNYPQAFSHIGLINSAWRLSEQLRTEVRQSLSEAP